MRHLRRLAAWLLPALVWTAAGGAEPAWTAPPDGSSDVIEFRRVFVPHDRDADWPRVTTLYLPVEAEKFEALVRTIRSVPSGTEIPVAAAVTAASYQARCEGAELVAGIGRLSVTHSSDRPTLLPLGPCNLAIAAATWQEQGQPAVIGIDAQGQLVLLVEQSGTLALQWSLRGDDDSPDAVAFDLELPRSVASRLDLDLPAGTSPLVEQAAVVAVPADDAARSHWTVELGGRHQSQLRLVRGLDARRRQLALFRMTTTYEFAEQGVEVLAQLRLDVLHDALRRLEVQLDPGMRLVDARYADSPNAAITWASTTRNSEGASRTVLELPEPILGQGRVLRLRALAPLRLGEAWRLPAIRVYGAQWQEGTLSLLVPHPLELRALRPLDCRQSRAAPLAAPLAGEVFDLQAHSESATAEIVLGRQRQPARLTLATSIDFDDQVVRGRCAARFDVSVGERFVLRGTVPQQWLVDTVESLPPEALADWSLAPPERDGRALTVRLNQAVAPNQPVTLVVLARRAAMAPSRLLTWDDLEIVRFNGGTTERHLLSAGASGNRQLHLESVDDLVRVDPAMLDPQLRQLLGEPPGELLIDVVGDNPRWRLAAPPRVPRYSALVNLAAEVDGDRLVESYMLTVTPESTGVDRLLVRFSVARDDPVQWTLGSEVRGQVVATRLDPEALGERGLSVAGETWELLLRRPRDVPFEIRARRASTWTDSTPLALPILPEATSQQGTIVVRAAVETSVAIDSRRLRAVPLETFTAAAGELVHAAYRYEAADDVGPAAASVVLSPPAAALPPLGALVWNSRIDSWLAADGQSLHTASMRIQSAGRRSLIVRLPSGARLSGAWVDERPASVQVDGQQLTFALHPQRRFQVVTAEFLLDQPPLAVLQQWSAPRLEIDVPVLARQWMIWLPASYSLAASPAVRPSLHAPRPAWVERVFGPLSRAADSAPFDPFDPADWTRLAGQPGTDAAQNAAAAAALLEHLAAAAQEAPSAPGGRLTWGQLLASTAHRLRSGSLRLIVDRESLSDLGIAPATAIGASLVPGDEPPAQRAVRMLSQAELALLVEDSHLILTATSTAAELAAAGLSRLSGVYTLLPGQFEQLLRSGRLHDPQQFISVEAWTTLAASPWAARALIAARGGDTVGWRAYRLEGADEVPAAWLVRVAAVRAAGWSAFLVVLACTWWWLRDRVRAMVGWICLLAAAALLVPELLIPIASGALLGALASLVGTIVLPRATATGAQPVGVGQSRSPQAVTVASLLLAAWLLSTGGPAAAQVAPDPTAARSADDVPRVFVPVDDQGRPTGGRYLVPESLDRQLRQRARDVADEPAGWVLRSADYRVALSREPVMGRYTHSGVAASFELRVFDEGAVVALPLDAAEVSVEPDSALLDGRNVDALWDADGKAVLVAVPRPGDTRLELLLRPAPDPTQERTSFRFRVPPSATARVRVLAPPEGLLVEVPTALGQTGFNDDRTELVAQLGPAPQLEVRWSERTDGRSGPLLDVEQLAWLRVRPGSVVVDTQFRLKVSSGQVRQIRVAADSKLRLLPLDVRDSLAAAATVLTPDAQSAGSRQTIVFDLVRPLEGEGTLRASFLVTGVSGIGQVRPPPIELVDARTIRRWLAVSVDPQLQFTTGDDPDLAAAAVPEFMTFWGRDERQPQLAFQASRAETSFSLATQPREPRATAEQTLFISVDRALADVWLEAQINTVDGYHFQHRLAVPPELTIESVSLVEDGVARVARWSRAEGDLVTVFLSGAVTGRQELVVRAKASVPLEGSFSLPPVRLVSAEVTSHVVQVFRRPAVLVTPDEHPGFIEEVQRQRTDPTSQPGRAVSVLLQSEPQATAAWTVAPNQPQVQVIQVSSLERDGTEWDAEVHCLWQAAGGLLDTIRFDVPPQWTGPYEITPTMAYEVARIPGDSRRQLLLRPRSAVGGPLRLSIRGPLVVAPGEAPSMPEIVPRGADQVEHYFRLPSQVGLESVHWETLRLEPAALPEPLADSALEQEGFVIERVTGSRPRAVLGALSPAAEQPRVVLADIHLAWQADGSYEGMAIFDVQSFGARNCAVRLPPRTQLLGVFVSGVSVSPRTQTDGVWEIPLLLEQLSQRVEVLYSGQLETARGGWERVRLEVPELVEWPVNQTLWTVYGPPGAGLGEPEGARMADLTMQEMARLEAITRLVDVPAEVVALNRSEEVAAWYRPWARIGVSCRDEVRRQLLDRPQTSHTLALEARVTAWSRDLSRIAQRLGTEATLAQVEASPQSADRPRQLWQRSFIGNRPVTRCALAGPAATLTIRYPFADQADFWWRIVAAAALVGLAAWVHRRAARWDGFCRWPAFFGVLAGLAWWLWLSPSFVGWLVVLASLTAGLRPSLRASREPGSTIVRIASGHR